MITLLVATQYNQYTAKANKNIEQNWVKFKLYLTFKISFCQLKNSNTNNTTETINNQIYHISPLIWTSIEIAYKTEKDIKNIIE